MNQCYPNILSVHHNYISVSSRPEGYLKSGWGGNDGTGGWHPLIQTSADERERERACVFIFYPNIVSHNHQEVTCKTDLGSLTLGLLHLYLYFKVKLLFNNTSCCPDQVTSHLWSCCALYVASSVAGGVHRHSWYNLEDLGRRGERDEVKERYCYWENKVAKETMFNRVA
jgi:hypothetical protein